MVTVAVFSTSNRTDSALYLPPAEQLSEAIGRWRTPDWELPLILPSSSVAAAAERLMAIVIGLRSPGGGWPEDLPQTAANLTPYVDEEAAELLDVLQSSAGMPSPSSSVALSADRFLLSALIPRLLWGIASSSYEMMRLLEGIKARVYEEDGTFDCQVVRLLPLLGFRQESRTIALDLVTQMASQEAMLMPQRRIQLLDSDIDSGPTTVAHLLAAMTRILMAEMPNWQPLLAEGWGIDLLFPHGKWQSGDLTLKLALAKVTGDFELQEAELDWSIPQALFRQDPVSSALDNAEVPSAIATNAPAPNSPASRADEMAAELLPQIDGLAWDNSQENSDDAYTLDDFAETVEPAGDNINRQRFWADASGLEIEPEAFPISQLQLPKASANSAQTTIPSHSPAGMGATWLTFTDEVWVQQFLLTVAQQSFLRRLSRASFPAESSPEEELALVTAAFEVSDQIQGSHDLFKYTFVHQPILGTDLWPRLRWHLARTSELLTQLMGGLPVRYLSPQQAWQTGLLFWQPKATITAADQTWTIDLTTGHCLDALPRQLVAETVVCPLAANLLADPLSLTKINHHIEAELEQQVPALATLKSATPVDIHRLETNPGHWSGHLTLDWGFTILHSAY